MTILDDLRVSRHDLRDAAPRFWEGGLQSASFGIVDTYEGEVSDPITLHKYLYAGADPVNNIDPSGKDFFGSVGLLVVSGIQGLLRNASAVGAFAVRQAAYALVRTQVAAYQAGLRLGILITSGAGASLRIADRVFAQLRDPRLTNWAGQLTPSMLRQLTVNPNAQRFVDVRNQGNVQIIQRLPAMSQNVQFRITLAFDELDQIISVGVIRNNQVANRIASGDFIPLP